MQRLVILGGGESGCGTAVLGLKQGWDVFLSDKGSLADNYKQALAAASVPFEEGAHTEELILNANLVVKSPGIPDTAPLVEKLRAKGIPVISEIEFAGRYTDARTICITGSNGKTTTTTLIYNILREAGFNVGLGGNIGASFALQVATAEHDWYVLELSSFQLDGMYEFKADIAVLANITPDHLDRYGYELGRYVDSKFGIVRNQTYDDYFIYSADDANIMQKLPSLELPMHLLPFTLGKGQERMPGREHSAWHGAHVDGDDFVAVVGERRFAMPVGELKIKGRHNLMNAMAAALAGMAAGADDGAIRRALTAFGGIEHRMEYAGEVGGVAYINDSKATNVDSVWYALESMDRPVVWIAGGTDKGNDYSALDEVVRGRVKTLVAMGLDNKKLVEHFDGIVPQIYEADNIADAMALASRSAAAGDAVLLSPACASFDLFKNYEDRGRQFKQWVGEHTLK